MGGTGITGPKRKLRVPSATDISLRTNSSKASFEENITQFKRSYAIDNVFRSNSLGN